MCNDARFDRHAKLVARMADALGVDIETSIQTGRMLPEELDTRIFDCMGCSSPGRCEQWLDAQQETATAAPAYCRNKDELDAMVRS